MEIYLQNDKGLIYPRCCDEVKRLVNSRYFETVLYILVVGLSLSQGCPNSRSCNSLEWTCNALDYKSCRPSFSKIDFTNCIRSTRSAEL